jgi:hypothetical protein
MASRTIVFSIGGFNLYRLIRFWISDLDRSNRSGFWHLINIIPFMIAIVAFINGNITDGAMWFFLALTLFVALGYWKVKIGIIIFSILTFIVIVWNPHVITKMIDMYVHKSIQGQGLQWIMISRWLSAFLLGFFRILLNLKVLILSVGIMIYLPYQLFTLEEMIDRNLLGEY